MSYLAAALQALVTHDLVLDGARLHVPGSVAIRLSNVLGNRRIHRLMDSALRPGATVVDVGANIGCNTVYAARRVGPRGRVIAVEPAGDNLSVLRRNLEQNQLDHVTVAAVAAGAETGSRSFYLRGDVSAVNSFYAESVYASVTDVVRVPVARLDDMVEGEADLVKVDVEGAELEVLAGMPRLLASPRLHLVVEWHPLLQEKAGYDATALPTFLLDRGFSIIGASHTRTVPVTRASLDGMARRLRKSGRPLDLLATPAGRT